MELIPQISSGKRLFYNENLFLPEEYYRKLLSAVSSDEIRFYPDPWSGRLVNALSDFLSVERGKIFVGAGADDLLRLLIGRANVVGIVEPSYSMYEFLAKSFGKEVRVTRYPEVDGVRGSDLIIANSPNNPTGIMYESSYLQELMEMGTLLLDEAYIEFSGERGYVDLAGDGLIVIRTFSKAWGLAGLRVGYAVMDEGIVEDLKSKALPYQVSQVSEAMAVKALELWKFVREAIQEMNRVKVWFYSKLRGLGIPYVESRANFVFLPMKGYRNAWKHLKDRGFLVRLIERPGAEGIRITLAPLPVMEELVEVLGELS